MDTKEILFFDNEVCFMRFVPDIDMENINSNIVEVKVVRDDETIFYSKHIGGELIKGYKKEQPCDKTLEHIDRFMNKYLN